jgi:lipopolysaccharide transport system ATP-binding protein
LGAPAIVVDGLSKRYEIGVRDNRHNSLRDQLPAALKQLITRQFRHRRDFAWALRDASFSVEEGEVLGLIGRNGAGKSTLLKILSRITLPTSGSADVYGRLGSLLEVGTGFHPDLTGRENVYLNGAILGMRRAEIRRKFDEIVEFAGVERFIETPVKRYSSGMYVRLAFAVAAHLDTEILLVDEVLAVGDAEFQRRCLGKLEGIGKSGRTVVFVSHNMPTITRLCERAILLEEGHIINDGAADDVVTGYLQSEIGNPAQRKWSEDDAPGDGLVRLRRVRVVDKQLETAASIDVRTPVGIEIGFDVLATDMPIRPQIMLTNEQGLHSFNAMDTNTLWDTPQAVGSYRSLAWIPSNLLNEGLMTVTVFLTTLTPGKATQHVLERDVVSFRVTDPVEGDSAKGDYVGQWHGAVRPLLEWTLESGLGSWMPEPSGSAQ